MTARWDMFFAPGTRVLALPGWRRPRLYLPADPFFGRWERSRLYPASLRRARLYRLSLRATAAAGAKRSRTLRSSSDWVLGDFVRDAMPALTSVVVLTGTPGPSQKITAQLRDPKGRVLGYLKYAEKDQARRRLRQESRMLPRLPAGIGPELVKFGPMGNGEALLSGLLPGESLSPRLPPPEGLVGLLESFVVSDPTPLDAHPWVRRVRSLGGSGPDSWLAVLAGRNWPVVIQHGDFTPWNLIRSPESILGAIDWEYGTLEGFPYLDLAYYILQTSALIHRWEPRKALRCASEYLTRRPGLGLKALEAQALTRLAAYDAYWQSSEDGQPEGTYLQGWRRRVWEEEL